MPVAIYNLEPYGDMVLYEDHLVEIANLNHIIAALEGQLKLESQEIQKLKFELHQLDDLASKL